MDRYFLQPQAPEGDFKLAHLALHHNLQGRLCQWAIAPPDPPTQYRLTLERSTFSPTAFPPIVCYQWRAREGLGLDLPSLITACQSSLDGWTVQPQADGTVQFTLSMMGMQHWLTQIQDWGVARSLSTPWANPPGGESTPGGGRFSPPPGRGWELCDRLQLSPLDFLHYSHGRCCEYLRQVAAMVHPPRPVPEPGEVLTPDLMTRPPYPVDLYCYTLVDVLDTLVRHPDAKTYLRQGYRLGATLHQGLGLIGPPHQWAVQGSAGASAGGFNRQEGWAVWVGRAAQVMLAHILQDGFGQHPLSHL